MKNGSCEPQEPFFAALRVGQVRANLPGMAQPQVWNDCSMAHCVMIGSLHALCSQWPHTARPLQGCGRPAVAVRAGEAKRIYIHMYHVTKYVDRTLWSSGQMYRPWFGRQVFDSHEEQFCKFCRSCCLGWIPGISTRVAGGAGSIPSSAPRNWQQ